MLKTLKNRPPFHVSPIIFCQILKRWLISWLTSQIIHRFQIFAILASFLWGNPKSPRKLCLCVSSQGACADNFADVVNQLLNFYIFSIQME